MEGHQEKPEERRYISLNWVAPKYFETLGTPFARGPRFRLRGPGPPARGDHQPGDGALLFRRRQSHRKACHYRPGRKGFGDDRPYEIMGVVGDAKYYEIREATPRTMYFNAFQEGRDVVAVCAADQRRPGGRGWRACAAW